MLYLLDTNAVISLLNDRSSITAAWAKQQHPSEIGVSSVVVHELYYGAHKSKRRDSNVSLIDNLPFEILEFDKEDARAAGQLRADLALAGTPIGPLDVLIAGQAVSRNLSLVTSNLKEFSRVKALKLVDLSDRP